MKKIVFTFCLLLIFSINHNYAQTKTIKGKVVAFKTYPLKKVKVISKKLKTETVTDEQGFFSIEYKKNDKLIFKAEGFQNSIVKIEKQDSLKVNLILVNNKNAFKDVVKEGHMEQSDLDYCTNNLMDENNNFDQMLTIYEIIQYVHPTARISDQEVNRTDENNTFGTTGNQIILDSRGPRSILASPFALLVVDGIVTRDISGIEPKQVKAIKILTGSDSGHWGTRGANGVVEITLKTN